MSIKSKSNAVRGTKGPPLFQSATLETVSTILPVTAGALAPLPTTAPEERIEQMYQVADIFASIFEALLDEHEHAIATTREAA
jgi:hypothetical protein